MGKKLFINGTIVGTTADNTDYTNTDMNGVTTAKGALDNLNNRLKGMEDGEGGSSASAPVIVVYGDSTASDNPSNNEAGLKYHSNTSIFKHIARICGASSYTNRAIHGGVLASSLITTAANERTDADFIFVLIGINNLYQQGSTVGDIDEIMALDSGSAALGSTILGMYRQLLETLHTRCPKARIVAITPLYNDAPYSWILTKVADFIDGMEIMCNRLGGTHERYIFVNTWAAGMNSKTYSDYYVDKTHPNDLGSLFYAHYIYLWGVVYPSDGVMYPSSPVAECTPSSISLQTSVGTPVEQTFNVQVSGGGNMTIRVDSGDSAMFSINPTSISADDNGDIDATVTVTYNPSSIGEHSSYIKFFPSRGPWFYMNLSGESS